MNISQIALDESRNILYTLAGQSTIDVIYLGPDGRDFQKVARLSDVFPAAQRALEIYTYSVQLDRNNFRIISIHPTLVAESKQIHLVAITSSGKFWNLLIKGYRLYFSCYNTTSSFGGISVQEDVIQVPSKLELVTARPPPATPDRLLSSFNGAATGINPATEMTTGLYSSGVMIGASVYNQDTFCITGVSPDFAFIYQKQMWSEMNSFLYVDGQAYAVAEVPHIRKYPCDTLGTSFNELDTQVTMGPRHFLVMSDLGISTFQKRRPIDYLVQLLGEANGKYTPGLKQFFEGFGGDQACAMCLAVACGNPFVSSNIEGNRRQSFGGSGPSVINGAKGTFFEQGGRASIPERMVHGQERMWFEVVNW